MSSGPRQPHQLSVTAPEAAKPPGAPHHFIVCICCKPSCVSFLGYFYFILILFLIKEVSNVGFSQAFFGYIWKHTISLTNQDGDCRGRRGEVLTPQPLFQPHCSLLPGHVLLNAALVGGKSFPFSVFSHKNKI
ncbi:unnamed protein product [Pipistrellus nathusii]|uniref:Uncharacterized protein n=1 Tax=Pipistrellus nathusii TaxID=59473 RepID=A0ABN9ZAP8_PIPNA